MNVGAVTEGECAERHRPFIPELYGGIIADLANPSTHDELNRKNAGHRIDRRLNIVEFPVRMLMSTPHIGFHKPYNHQKWYFLLFRRQGGVAVFG
jgi:hypothetical protein